jgi:heme oxygenase-like protein
MVPLMEAALERARVLAPEDPVAGGLAAYLDHHIPEERHSDEPGGAVLDDLAALGLDPVEVRALPATRQVAAVVAAQLAWISDRHPVAILGFLELEAHQADRVAVERLIKKTGLPRAGFGQLLLHARLDPVHARELHRVLDSLPLEPEHEQLIGRSALHTMSLITDALLDAIEVVAPQAPSRLDPESFEVRVS